VGIPYGVCACVEKKGQSRSSDGGCGNHKGAIDGHSTTNLTNLRCLRQIPNLISQTSGQANLEKLTYGYPECRHLQHRIRLFPANSFTALFNFRLPSLDNFIMKVVVIDKEKLVKNR
jgi:hypothetical protein